MGEKNNTLDNDVLDTSANLCDDNVVSEAPLLRRAFIFLEDGEWNKADEYCERVLDSDPESAHAYVGKLMAELHVNKQEQLKECEESFEGTSNYQKALKYGDEKLCSELEEYIAQINERKRAEFWEKDRKEKEARLIAEEAAEKRKKTLKKITPIVVICSAFLIILFTVIIPQMNYHAAVSKYGQEATDKFYALNVGDKYTLGDYGGNIVWRVLEKGGNRALVISDEILDWRPYDRNGNQWDNSDIKGWLNGNFVSRAFDDEQQAMISSEIFLLSVGEAEKYFKSDDDRWCGTAGYTSEHIDYESYNWAITLGESCSWWLTDNGYFSHAYVYGDGSINTSGWDADRALGVRPALWITM